MVRNKSIKSNFVMVFGMTRIIFMVLSEIESYFTLRFYSEFVAGFTVCTFVCGCAWFYLIENLLIKLQKTQVSDVLSKFLHFYLVEL